ncbi:MAG: SRPBCC domain-containing protein [Acidobacteria bacterium]|nr:SRPBCC domain-containing protein [Acidobacteriota bacterium]
MTPSGHSSASTPLSFTSSISIVASPGRVLEAFFNPGALSAWWQTARSVTVPRVLGAYAVEWDPTDFKDEMLGRLGGTFHGTVVDFKEEREFFVADAFWMPPDGSPIGPMALEVRCERQRTRNPQITLVHVTQRAAEDGERWKRYYEVIAPGWERALQSLKAYLERTSRG